MKRWLVCFFVKCQFKVNFCSICFDFVKLLMINVPGNVHLGGDPEYHGRSAQSTADQGSQ